MDNLSTDLNDIPNTPGVYLFFGEGIERPIYIGKSIHLRTRVRSHFSSANHDTKEFKLCSQTRRIEWIETAGELSALLLESQLVKQELPIYNRKLRQIKRLCGFQLMTNTPYHHVKLATFEKKNGHNNGDIFGVFRSKKQAEKHLIEMVKDYRLCPKLCYLECTKTTCFSYQLKRCSGACIGLEDAQSYNMRLWQALSTYQSMQWPFEGPIVYQENCKANQKRALLYIDQWCLLDNLADMDDNMSVLKKSRLQELFCLDEMKLIQQFILNNPEKITLI